MQDKMKWKDRKKTRADKSAETTGRNRSKDIGERKKIRKISRQHQAKQDSKQRKKILPTIRWSKNKIN